MQTATLGDTIGDLVTSNPSRARLFENLGLDYCCGGRKPLAQACQEKGLDAPTVLKLLVGFDEQVSPSQGELSWSDASLTSLANHIEHTHHAYLKAELPRLGHLVTHVAERHGGHAPHLIRLRDTFIPLKMELQAHMAAEEEVVFPACRALETGASRADRLDGSIALMVQEHDQAGEALSRIRELTDGFVLPPDACNTYRVMYAALGEFAEDMHRHVHKENSILFPRAIEAERKQRSATT